VREHGDPAEALAVTEVRRDRTGGRGGKVRVKVSAAVVNFNDIDRVPRQPRHRLPPLPFTIGMDVCGESTAAGEAANRGSASGSSPSPPRQRRAAEYAIAPAVAVFDAPPELDDAEHRFLLPFHNRRAGPFHRAKLPQPPVHRCWCIPGRAGLGTARSRYS